jgi:ABC-type Zn uptake system ZnuABC Zn-binding protein ZnuA
MKSSHAGVVLVEPFENRRTAEKVAAETGAKVVDVTQYPAGLPGTAGGYLEMMNTTVQAIAKALRETAPPP